MLSWGRGRGNSYSHGCWGQVLLASLGFHEGQGVAAASPAGLLAMSGVLAGEGMVFSPCGTAGPSDLSCPGSAPSWVPRAEAGGAQPGPASGGGTWHTLAGATGRSSPSAGPALSFHTSVLFCSHQPQDATSAADPLLQVIQAATAQLI